MSSNSRDILRKLEEKAFITRAEFSTLLDTTMRSIDRYAQTDPNFPQKIYISKRKVFFSCAEITAWLKQQGGAQS